jgi:tetratricopeptide (TPR) repeat protein
LQPAAGIPSTEQGVQFFQERVVRDPRDFISFTCLSELQIRRARETGDVTHYERAEASARAALALRERYAPAMVQLAAVHAAQHRFKDAKELARKAVEIDPRQSDALLVVGDCHMALGEYEQAERTFVKLQQQGTSPAVSVRLAHLSELRGDYDEAIELTEAAVKVIVARRGSTEELAWYQSMLGELNFETGRLDQAARHFEASLKAFADYHVALAGLGKVRAAQGQINDAIELYRQAAESSPQIATLAALGDLHLKKDDTPAAQRYFNQIESLASQPGARTDLMRRDLSLFYADHDLNLSLALELAEADFAERQDIFANDARAWALYKNSRRDEAAAAIEQALRLGSRHPTLCFHAGMIYYGLGDNAKARSYLKRAVAMNPQFSILYADEARRTIAKLGDKVDASAGD